MGITSVTKSWTKVRWGILLGAALGVALGVDIYESRLGERIGARNHARGNITQITSTSLDAPSITATGVGPDQINLTWSDPGNEGWGYRVEIQSDDDSRYTSWTELSWQNGKSYLPYWVTETGGTEAVYTDPLSASSGWGDPAQLMVFGLIYSTSYNFRVRTWGQNDSGTDIYSSYSATDTGTTTTPSVIRYVDNDVAGGSNDGTSWANAWDALESANSIAGGTLILVDGGNYTSDHIYPTNSGTSSSHTVYQCVPGDTCTITTTNSGSAITLTTSFVVIDGVNTTAVNGGNPSIFITGNRNAAVNLSTLGDNISDEYGQIMMQGADYSLVHNVLSGNNGSDQEQGHAFVTQIGADRNTVEYSHLTESSHDTGLTQNASYNRIYNNLHDGGQGLGWEDVSTGGACTGNLFEGNLVKDVSTDAGYTAYKPGIEISCPYTTVRRNVIIDGEHITNSVSPGIEISSPGAETPSNSLIYQNTVYNNAICILGFSTSGGNSNITVANNICWKNYSTTIYDMLWTLGVTVGIGDSAWNNLDVNSNDILFSDRTSTDPDEAVIQENYGTPQSVAEANANSSHFTDNTTYGPIFLDETGREFHLKSTNTDLIDGGVQVTDSIWGTLGYDGSAPDIGAFEYRGIE